MKKLLIGLIIGLLLSGTIAIAQIGGGIGPASYWYSDGTGVFLSDSAWHLGSTGTRIAKGWFTDIDASGVFTLGGTVSGSLDMANSTIVNIGNAGTDFTSTGGLTLAGVLTGNATATFAGNVGIGTASPNTPLHIYNSGAEELLRLQTAGTNSYARIWYQTDNAVSWNVGARNDGGLGGAFSFENNYSGWASKLFITTAGNVGIGTTNPANGKLQVAGGVTTALRLDANSGVAAMNIGGIGEIIVDALGVGGGRFVVKDSGNVGIGTAAPQQKLTLSSGSNFATEMAVPSGVSTATTTGGTLPAGTYYFKVVASEGVGTTIGSSEVSQAITTVGEAVVISWSAVTGASSYQVYGNTTASQNHYFTTTATSYTYSTSTGSTAGTVPTITTAYITKLTASGNSWLLGGSVGIGTTTPAYTLDVEGNIHANNYYSEDGTQGWTGTCAAASSTVVKDGLVTGCI